MIAANTVVAPLLAGVDAGLLQPPVNVLRLSLHPQGLARRIANLVEWRAHLLDRLRRQIEISADPVLASLMTELRSYPAPYKGPPGRREDYAGMVVPLELRTDDGVLALFSTTTVFGTPVDITLSELALELFFPANPQTAEALRRLVASKAG